MVKSRIRNCVADAGIGGAAGTSAPPTLRVVIAGLLASLAPLILLLANRDWFFTPEGFLDPWQYVGFFRYYEDLDYYPGDYKLGRLPWILIGYGITRVMPTMPSAYLLHALFLCLTPLVVFGAMYVLLRRVALAAVVALCVGFYAQGHGSGGWDYHNTPSGFFFFAALWLCALPAAVRGSAVVWSLVGVMAALTVHTNTTLVNLIPVLAYVHVEVARSQTGAWPRWQVLLARAGWALLGIFVITAILGAVHWRVGRGPVFFEAMLNILIRYLTEKKLQGGRPLSDFSWVLVARYLALPGAVFVAALLSLVRDWRAAGPAAGRVSRALVIQCVALSLLWGMWQAAGHTALDWDYMAYGLMLSAFIALGGILAPAWPASLERHWLWTVLATALLLALCLIAGLPAWVSPIESAMQPAIFLFGTLFFLVPLALCVWRLALPAAAITIVALAVGNRLVAPIPSSYAASDPCKVQPAVYAGIVEGASHLVTIDPLYRRQRIWFDERETINPLKNCPIVLGLMAYSMRTMAWAGYITPPFPMPGVDDVPASAILALKDTDAFLTIITNKDEHIEEWDRRLKSLGLVRRDVAEYRVPVMESGFRMQAWTIGTAP